MSLTTRLLTAVIGTSEFLGGDPVLMEEEPVMTGEGWDSMALQFAIYRASLTAEECATFFPIGGRYGERTFWINGSRPRRIAAGVWGAEVSLKGWAQAKPPVIKVGSAGEQQTADMILAPGHVGDTIGRLFAKVSTEENAPTISVSHLVEDVTTTHLTDKVGTAQTPPVSIPVPDSVWTFLVKYVWHWPQGWVLMASNEDRLPGTNAAYVTDEYKYIRDKTPG